jgi:proteasome lid subunit RPN8/RPN11
MTRDEIRDKLKGIAFAAGEAHAESCGFVGWDGGRESWALYPLTNISSAPGDRYETAPDEQLEVFAELQAQGMVLWGVYHTHQETPMPSPTDVSFWEYPPELKMVIATPDQVAVYIYLGPEEGIVTTLWP